MRWSLRRWAGGQKLRLPTVVGAELTGGLALIRLTLGQLGMIGEARVNLQTGAMTKRTCDPMDEERSEPCP
jgi:hypothetical protein